MINLHESIGPGSNSRSLYQQSNPLPIALQGQVILGFLFYLNWPWIYKFSFCPIWLLWSHTIWIIDCWAHWPGLSVRCIWGIRRGFGEQGKMAFISGEQRKKGQILRATETKLGNREYKKTKFEGTEEQANLFQRNKETCIPHLRGLRISLRRQNTTEVMTYNITWNSPL